MTIITDEQRQRIQARQQLLGEMIGRAETIIKHLPNKPSHYDLLCLWMAIISSQVAAITDTDDHKVMKVLVSKILDTEIEGRVIDATGKSTGKPYLKLV